MSRRTSRLRVAPMLERSALRDLVTLAVSDEELSNIAFEQFRSAYQQFDPEQPKSARVRTVVDEAIRNQRIQLLLNRVREANPAGFAALERITGGGTKLLAGLHAQKGMKARDVFHGTPQSLEQLSGELSYDDPIGAHQTVRALQNQALGLPPGEPTREEAITHLKVFLVRDSPRGQQVRPLRQEVMRAIKRLGSRELGWYFRDGALEGQDLWAMDFSNADLSGVSFARAFVIESDFANSNLRGCNFCGASIRNVRFYGSDLSSARFANADWFNALGFTPEQLGGAYGPLLPRPKDVDGFHRYLAQSYVFPFHSWSPRVQQELLATWRTYSGPEWRDQPAARAAESGPAHHAAPQRVETGVSAPAGL